MFAWTIVVVVHTLLWWLIHKASEIDPMSSGDDEALQLAWLVPVPPPVSVDLPPTPHPELPALEQRRTRRDALRAVANSRSDESAPVASSPTDASAVPDTTLSAIFIEQVRRAGGVDAGSNFAQDPLANRDIALPGKSGGRLAMQRELTTQDVLRGIGQLFGGPGYTTNPCPQIRRNIANNMAMGGDEAMLAEEIHRREMYCN